MFFKIPFMYFTSTLWCYGLHTLPDRSFFFFFFTLPLPLVTRKATLPLYLSHSKIFLDSLSLDPVHMPSHTLQLTYIPFGLYVQNNCYLYSYMDIMSEDVYVCICVHGKKGIQ